ncbi:MAG: tagaturonate reductase [Cecembia sp.]
MKKLNKTTVPIPDRPVKVLQFGSGNFLRGFADWMIELMNARGNYNGSVVVVQSHSPSVPQAFLGQDNLYHVLIQGIEKGKTVNSHQLITCIETVINPVLEYNSFLQQAENPDLELIISNTTEAGIQFDPMDIPTAGQTPKTFPGKLTALLYKRFEFFDGDMGKGLSLIPCELIENNGAALKAAVLKYIALWDYPEAFKRWIMEAVDYCNSLVDRIVPGFPENNYREMQEQLGYEDHLMVVAEPFHLWVIEASPVTIKRFPAIQAGLQVKFVADLAAYRTRKVRILNGAHTAMVSLGLLAGIETVKEVIEDNELGILIRQIIFEEIIPVLELPKKELEAFAQDVLDRFSNPFIRHELSSIALNSISKFRVRVLPTILDYHKKLSHWPAGLIQSFAALLLLYKGTFNGMKIHLKDEPKILKIFQSAWEKKQSLNELVNTLISEKALWGEDLSQVEGLIEVIEKELKLQLSRHGQ